MICTFCIQSLSALLPILENIMALVKLLVMKMISIVLIVHLLLTIEWNAECTLFSCLFQLQKYQKVFF